MDVSQRISYVQEADGTITREYGDDMVELQAGYAAMVAKLEGLEEPGDLEPLLGAIVASLLLRRGIASTDAATRQTLLREFARALREGLEARARKASGDYRPDPVAERFPAFVAPEITAAPVALPQVSLTGLLDEWWKEAEAAGRSQSTKESYRKSMTELAKFLGHDDAAKVTAEDVLRFKDHLFAVVHPRTKKQLDAKTIKDGYFSGLKTVFGWAAANRRVAANPVQGVTIKVGRRVRLRDPWFTPGEIASILAAAANLKSDAKEPAKKHALKRWVPWLCAYTGARVGEIAQLRKQDVRSDGDRWVITITPDAITVKDKERREVPLHAHLVEAGFPEFLQASGDGYLFLWSGDDRSALRTAKNRIRDFVRTVVSDLNVQPNHGWRHTFKTLGSEAGIEARTLDAICGHDPRTVGEGYTGVTLLTKARAIARFPRFDVSMAAGE